MEKDKEKENKKVFTKNNGGGKPAPGLFSEFNKGIKKNPRRILRHERPRSEFEQKIISIRRVTRVVAGGRRFTFSVAVVVGDKNGSVGFGMGKSNDTSAAIEKAVRKAKKNMIKVALDENMSIPMDIKAKYSSSVVELWPAPGRGISVGSSVRDVVEMAGIKDVSAKILSRSRNKVNNAMAAIKALESILKK